jgi:twinkle protein
MLLTVSDLSAQLVGRIEELAPMLLPGGRKHGNEWICGDLSGAPGDSLKLTMTGGHAGQWRDWATDDHGDLVDLWRLSRAISAGEAISAVRTYLGISEPVRQHEKRVYGHAPAIKSEVPSPNGRAYAWLTQTRGLKPEIIERLKIEIDTERKAIVFPCISPAGEIINRSYRTLGEKKKVWQDKDCAPSLFGWQAITESSYRSKTILLCEGQIDAATWHQWGIPALSVPNGTGATWVEFEWDNLQAFDSIYLAFDQDEAGRKISDMAVTRLGKHRCFIVAMPKKDANDCLLAGFTAEDARDWVANAKRPRIERLVTTAEMEDRLVEDVKPKPEPFSMPFLKMDWHNGDGFYFRPGELTIWGGFSHAGKSTMLNFMVAQLLGARIPVFIGSFEIRVETQLRKMLSVFYGKKNINETAAREFARNVGESIVFSDVVGSITKDSLMEMMWFSHRRYGTSHFVIDSLMRVQGLEEDYPAQGEFCNRLQDFAKETGSHLHLVAHLAKPAQDGARPSMYAIKGSSLMVNNADNVLLVLRNPEKEKKRKAGKLTSEEERSMHDTEIIVEKQRETGWLGMFKLNFDSARFRFTEFDSTKVMQ